MTSLPKNCFINMILRAFTAHMIIPDIRYEHDILEIQKRGGIVIKVERENAPVRHTFEQHIDFLKGNHRLHNTGSIEDLRTEVIKMMELVKAQETL